MHYIHFLYLLYIYISYILFMAQCVRICIYIYIIYIYTPLSIWLYTLYKAFKIIVQKIARMLNDAEPEAIVRFAP